MNKSAYILLLLFLNLTGFCQQPNYEFRLFPIERLPPDKRPRFYEILCSKSGSLLISSSHGILNYQGFRINFPSQGLLGDKTVSMTELRNYHAEDSIRSLCNGIEGSLFFLTKDNKVFYISEDLISLTGWSFPPLSVQPGGIENKAISKLWVDKDGDLFIGTENDSLVIIPGAAKLSPLDGIMDSKGNFISEKLSRLQLRKIFLSRDIKIFSFEQDTTHPETILIGTNKGIIWYNKKTGKVNLEEIQQGREFTVTDVELTNKGDVWFSTLEKGMGFYDYTTRKYSFFPLLAKRGKPFLINNFCRKSANELFIAVVDSLPAIFNMHSGTYLFLSDSIFRKSKDSTSDIKMDGFGNLFVVKGGALYYSKSFAGGKMFASVKPDSTAYTPFIYDMRINGHPYYEVLKTSEPFTKLKTIRLQHNENVLEFGYSLYEFWDQRNTEMNWKLDGLNMDWVSLPRDATDKYRATLIPPLAPGKYVFRVRARVGNENWRKQEAQLNIIIVAPYWQTWWFWTIIMVLAAVIILFLVRWRVVNVRKQERIKAKYEKEALELESKALRAQMNPHFIFNCMNSIKALMQNNEDEKAIKYLTTFSKLIRTLFNNADKKEISLHDEIETCRLYLELEAMRFEGKLTYDVIADPLLDLKSIQVPALIIQPFIENAIWHGIVPKNKNGYVSLSVVEDNGSVVIVIEDDGIGRQASLNNKPTTETSHQSKGLQLTQSRLQLDNALRKRNAEVNITDKKNASGIATGTKVTLIFNDQLQ